MKETYDGNAGPLRKREPDRYSSDPSGPQAHQAPDGASHLNGHTRPPTFSFWVIADLLLHRWGMLLFGLVAGSALFYMLGVYAVKPKFSATAQMVREESLGVPEFLKAAPITAETFAGLIRSPELLRRVGASARPPLPPEVMAKCIKVDPEPDSAMVKVILAARDPQQAVELLNLFLIEAEKFTKEWQQVRSRVVADEYLAKQVGQMDHDISTLSAEFRGVPEAPQVTTKLAEIGSNLSALSNNLAASPRPTMLIEMNREKLTSALGELQKLMINYTEKHPLVMQQRSLVDELQRQLGPYTNQLGSGFTAAQGPGRSSDTFNPDLDIIRTKLRSLHDARTLLVERQREAELYATNSQPMATIFAPANLKTVQRSRRELKISLLTIFGGLLGLGGSLALVGLVELTDRRLRTIDDVRRVTRLPVLTTLGNLQRMRPEARAQWAFRTWTMLQGRLSHSANHGLVCGITSSTQGEGRSTWISLLSEAASLTGFRVLTIATRPSPTHFEADGEETEDEPVRDQTGETDTPPGQEVNPGHNNHSGALTSNVLASPAKVTEQLTGPNSQPVVHIPLPGWVWNLERRKQWREALQHWRQIENLVIFVELPPGEVPESVLLGCNLPNLIWLADSGTADAAQTRLQLETLRNARCNLVGAVLNRESAPSLKRRFPRWLDAFALIMILPLWTARAQLPAKLIAAAAPAPAPVAAQPPVPGETPAISPPAEAKADTIIRSNVSFSIVNPAQRAAWQQRLTLGPGDVLNFALYGQPELNRAEVAINPDGRVSFLEAEVLATGLTIDELRAKLDEALGTVRRSPHTMITPVAFKSKKYYMLGKVMTKGVYTLDRPITIVEAIARAHGFENGLVDRNIIDIADFQHSFLARGGKRFPLNFEKLFQGGDLSQNIAIEPEDYLYFPSTNVKEVYVVGEVRLPGPVTYTPATTIIAAITARGGYSERAYKARVIVVRGPVNNPEAIAVDTHAILDGNAPDFQLRPKDIIYVNSRPFIRVEELADLAFTAFMQSLISEWVGVGVVKPIE
jgi:protein involved in polysaccharide export with SLBB domain/capsular polysaccharide biosynthesis protein